jgi:hypothetical protein
MSKYDHFGCAQDWVVYVKKYIEKFKIHSLLELGVGNGTEFLLDNCDHVTSLEIIESGLNDYWFNLCLEKYKTRDNWENICIKTTDTMKKANQLAISERYPLKYTDHIKEYTSLIKGILEKRNYDMVFVDVGIHNRGDLVNILLQEKIKVVFAHDTSRDPNRILKNIYGYNIVSNNDYTEIHFEDTYMGTTFWILNSEKEIINHMNGTKQ